MVSLFQNDAAVHQHPFDPAWVPIGSEISSLVADRGLRMMFGTQVLHFHGVTGPVTLETIVKAISPPTTSPTEEIVAWPTVLRKYLKQVKRTR
jgi:hypothetical protein